MSLQHEQRVWQHQCLRMETIELRTKLLELDQACARWRARYGELPAPITEDLESMRNSITRCLGEPDEHQRKRNASG